MRPGFQSKAVRPFAAAAAAGILTVGLVTAPPAAPVALPRAEVHALTLVVTTVDIPTTVTPTSPRSAAANQTANDTAEPPDFLALAASILEYLNSLGFGAAPGLAAIGLSGFVVAFAATAYAWNHVADTVNPGLSFLRIPKVPKFPVCFAGQTCASGAAAAQARVIKPALGALKPARAAVKPAGRSVATSKRDPGAAKVRDAQKSTPSAASTSGKATGKRARTAATH